MVGLLISRELMQFEETGLPPLLPAYPRTVAIDKEASFLDWLQLTKLMSMKVALA